MIENPLAGQVRSELKKVIDPELGINVIDLGLIYDLDIRQNHLKVVMTMTSPACPINAFLAESIKSAILATIPQIRSVEVEVVWEPPWSPQKMSEEARRLLGY